MPCRAECRDREPSAPGCADAGFPTPRLRRRKHRTAPPDLPSENPTWLGRLDLHVTSNNTVRAPSTTGERMLKIYGVPVSVHTRKVIVAAIEKDLPFENEPVIPFNPPAGWAELSPTGKIPVARDGDLVLRDSSVICAYLERAHPHAPLYPAAAADYARALWYEEYADSTLFPAVVHGLFFQKVIRPGMLNEK